jgi:hypothetical protein
VIEFAEPDQLDFDGSTWLRIHALNMFGGSGDVEVKQEQSTEDAEGNRLDVTIDQFLFDNRQLPYDSGRRRFFF